MAHHKINIRLSQMIEAGSFGKNPADHLMCDLTATFLVWSLRVTVEDSCTYLAVLITLDGQRISELTSSISEHHLKELLESFATKSLIEPIEYICYRPGCVGIAYECKHEFTVPEINCEQYLTTFTTFNRVHFIDGNIRTCSKECPDVFISTANVALLVYLDGALLLSDSIPDFPREIEVANRKEIGINIIVDGLLITHD